MSEQRTVGTAILELLVAQGVDTVFGLPGVHNLAFWSSEPDSGGSAAAPGQPDSGGSAAAPGQPDSGGSTAVPGQPDSGGSAAVPGQTVRIIGVRHEQACVYAADGYARSTGRLGVALTTTGPGAINALAAFGEAAVSGVPVLLISSDVSTALRSPEGPRGILHEMGDQAAPFAALGRPSRTVTSAEEALTAVAQAMSLTMSAPRGPAYVGIPSDILNAPWDGPLPAVPPPSAPPPVAADVSALADLIAVSPRVVIWSGGGVGQGGACGETAVRSLAERLGAPVVTTYAGRGVMAGHPLAVETSTHEPEVEALIGSSDLLLVIGSGFDAMHTKNWKMALPERRAAISLGAEVGRTIPWDALVQADLVETIDAVLPLLPVEPRQPWAPTDLRACVQARLRSDTRTAPPIDFVAAIDAWPEHGAVVTDMCIPGYWVSSHGRQPRMRRLLNPVGWGTLGYALPAAIGPAAAGVPTLAVCGDGGPMFALGEFASLVQERLPVTLLIVDDGGYGMLRFDQQVFGHPERGVDLVTPDWGLLARSFGIAFAEVTDADGLRAELAIASARPGPTLILQRTLFYPPASTSPRWFESATGPRETA